LHVYGGIGFVGLNEWEHALKLKANAKLLLDFWRVGDYVAIQIGCRAVDGYGMCHDYLRVMMIRLLMIGFAAIKLISPQV
jgi:hypothetical protein